MNNYLIPANSKKSALIVGFFTPVDLGIFVMGVVVSVLLLLIVGADKSFGMMIVLLIPALISGALIAPLPYYYHNVLQFLTNIFRFISNRRSYYWRGWCFKYDRKN